MNILSMLNVNALIALIMTIVGGLFPGLSQINDNPATPETPTTTVTRPVTDPNTSATPVHKPPLTQPVVDTTPVPKPPLTNPVTNPTAPTPVTTTPTPAPVVAKPVTTTPVSTAPTTTAPVTTTPSPSPSTSAPVTSAPEPAPAPAPAPVQNDAARITAETNAVRARNGVAPLQTDQNLSNSSARWATYLAQTGKFEHDTNRTTGNFRGENIYRNSGGSTANAVNAWVNSPGHFRNLVDSSYRTTGVGVAFGADNSVVVVQRFN